MVSAGISRRRRRVSVAAPAVVVGGTLLFGVFFFPGCGSFVLSESLASASNKLTKYGHYENNHNQAADAWRGKRAVEEKEKAQIAETDQRPATYSLAHRRPGSSASSSSSRGVSTKRLKRGRSLLLAFSLLGVAIAALARGRRFSKRMKNSEEDVLPQLATFLASSSSIRPAAVFPKELLVGFLLLLFLASFPAVPVKKQSESTSALDTGAQKKTVAALETGKSARMPDGDKALPKHGKLNEKTEDFYEDPVRAVAYRGAGAAGGTERQFRMQQSTTPIVPQWISQPEPTFLRVVSNFLFPLLLLAGALFAVAFAAFSDRRRITEKVVGEGAEIIRRKSSTADLSFETVFSNKFFVRGATLVLLTAFGLICLMAGLLPSDTAPDTPPGPLGSGSPPTAIHAELPPSTPPPFGTSGGSAVTRHPAQSAASEKTSAASPQPAAGKTPEPGPKEPAVREQTTAAPAPPQTAVDRTTTLQTAESPGPAGVPTASQTVMSTTTRAQKNGWKEQKVKAEFYCEQDFPSHLCELFLPKGDSGPVKEVAVYVGKFEFDKVVIKVRLPREFKSSKLKEFVTSTELNEFAEQAGKEVVDAWLAVDMRLEYRGTVEVAFPLPPETTAAAVFETNPKPPGYHSVVVNQSSKHEDLTSQQGSYPAKWKTYAVEMDFSCTKGDQLVCALSLPESEDGPVKTVSVRGASGNVVEAQMRFPTSFRQEPLSSHLSTSSELDEFTRKTAERVIQQWEAKFTSQYTGAIQVEVPLPPGSRAGRVFFGNGTPGYDRKQLEQMMIEHVAGEGPGSK